MKRKNFIKEIIKKGCFLRRHGTRHDIYENTNNGKIAPIPRHNEIKESLCRIILKTIRFIRNKAVLPKPFGSYYV
ncbi:MAG: type II toxin-antitoxin system HicA family toxin [Spirochaetales bacterium]|nr:type II toxin-antitoxin system HicA family toxin [Spirochaetales bacterium]